MHVHELNPSRTLTTVVIFVFVLIIGFLTMQKPLITYEKNLPQSITDLTEAEGIFYPWELEAVINNQTDTIFLVDIRDNFSFGQGHIPGAENISANDLVKKENIKRLHKLKEMQITVVLYGEDELQANGPWMVFRQSGFGNVKLLLGGYQYYAENKDDLYSTVDDDAYFKGFPRYNFAEKAAPKNGAALNQATEKKPVEVRRREKTNIAAGGC